MSSPKQRIREKLEVEEHGCLYLGERIIEGKASLDQYIIYQNRCIPDIKGYDPAQKDKMMLTIAKMILRELVAGRTISAQPKEKYGL